MNYTFYWDGQPWDADDILIGQISRDPWQRPTLGQEIKIRGKIVKVTRINPASNPSNTSVTYYVESVNNNAPYKARK